MKADELSKMTAEELRALAAEKNIRWQDKNGKPLRKMDLLDVLEYELKKQEADDTAEVALPRVPTPKPPAPEPAAEPATEPAAVDASPHDGPFRVTKDCRYVTAGVAHQLKRGTIVQNEAYDLAALREQNVPMEPVNGIDLQPGDDITRRIEFEYGPPVIGVREYVPIGETPIAHRPADEAQYVEMLPDGTREPVPGTPVPKRVEIEAKVKR